MTFIEKYMSFDLTDRAAQGMAVWGNNAFILYDGGTCSVYNLKSRSSLPVDTFPLGSVNPGIPSKEYRNHANSCMFSNTHWKENPIPLLYITIGSGIGYDQDGYYYRCSVENIACSTDEKGNPHYNAKVLQTITYKPDGIKNASFDSPTWGCPCFLTDNEYLYIFSAKYRTKAGCVPEGENNEFIITKFPLPEINAGNSIRLTPTDILDQFSIESNTLFTQGGMIQDHLLYYTFGFPKGGYPVKMMIFDLEKQCLVWESDAMDQSFDGEEIECCSFYQNQLLCNTSTGSIFRVTLGTDGNILPKFKKR